MLFLTNNILRGKKHIPNNFLAGFGKNSKSGKLFVPLPSRQVIVLIHSFILVNFVKKALPGYFRGLIPSLILKSDSFGIEYSTFDVTVICVWGYYSV